MCSSDINLLEIDRGAVTAPAGCGKTHLIAESLLGHAALKPVLILTHTNAGVAALRGRLGRAGVPRRSYRLSTIDGWAMRLAATFPLRSAIETTTLRLDNPRADYPAIQLAALRLLRERHINQILDASYARLIVDEYQDCTSRQDALLRLAAETLRTCTLGDPLQAIFGFAGDNLPVWSDVCEFFPVVGELTTPWRWRNADAETLGRWLLHVRAELIRGAPVDLRSAPDAVKWIELDGADDHQKRLAAARVRVRKPSDHVLIIGDSTRPNSHRQIASQVPGAVTVEAVDLSDLVRFARRLRLFDSDALQHVVNFAHDVMTNVGAPDILRRVTSLENGTARKPATSVESAALAFKSNPSYGAVADLLVEIGKEAAVRSHRPDILRACLKALQASAKADEAAFLEACIRMREENRLNGRELPKRAVGSTLLLKGLEAEIAVILNADALNAKNLYVAMTRGSRELLICSRSPVLSPK